MVVRLDRVALLTRGARRQRAGRQAHVVVGALEAAEHAPVLLVAEDGGQVLMKRPTTGDVEDLHAAADPEHGQVALQRAPHERDLERVARRDAADRLRISDRPVDPRIDVRAAGEHQAVDPVEHLVGICDERRVGREQQRHRAGTVDGVDVVARQQEGIERPRGPARELNRGADADRRSGHPLHASAVAANVLRGEWTIAPPTTSLVVCTRPWSSNAAAPPRSSA